MHPFFVIFLLWYVVSGKCFDPSSFLTFELENMYLSSFGREENKKMVPRSSNVTSRIFSKRVEMWNGIVHFLKLAVLNRVHMHHVPTWMIVTLKWLNS